MSEPVAQMLERLAALEAACHGEWYKVRSGTCGHFETWKLSTQFTDRGGMHEAAATLAVEARNALPKLLALVKSADEIVETVRLIIAATPFPGFAGLNELIAAYDAASRGAGQRGEVNND